MKIVPFQKKPDRSFLIKLPALFLAVLATFSACSGSNNTSSTPIPLPNGQAGSLITANGNRADCFATTSSTSPYLTLCTGSSPSAAGTNGVTALNTVSSATTSPPPASLIVGTTNGNVNVVNSVYSSPTVSSYCQAGSLPSPRLRELRHHHPEPISSPRQETRCTDLHIHHHHHHVLTLIPPQSPYPPGRLPDWGFSIMCCSGSQVVEATSLLAVQTL